MTRAQARMIAEELYKLIKKDIPCFVHDAVIDGTDEYFNTAQAAEFLGVSVSYVKSHINDIPHTKVGRLNKFKKSSLSSYMSRR